MAERGVEIGIVVKLPVEVGLERRQPPYFFFLCKYIKAQKPTSTDKSIMPTGGRLKDEQSPPLVAKFSMRKMLTKCSVQSLVVLSVSIYSPKARSKPLI